MSSSPGTGLGLSGHSPGSRIWGAGATPWCFGVDSLMSDAVVVGRLLPLPSCGGRTEEQKSEFLLSVHLPGSSQLCRHRSVWGWRWPAGSGDPGRRRVANQHSHSLHLRKEWGKKPSSWACLSLDWYPHLPNPSGSPVRAQQYQQYQERMWAGYQSTP